MIRDEDSYYGVDDTALGEVRTQSAWISDPKYFKRVKISPSAAIKMAVHGQSGVEKGLKRSGNPIEVMGLLVGRPDIEDPHCIIISDAQALPVEGFETRVIADDDTAMNFMIELGETNDITRKERFCGWYHTHPFDFDVHSNCYLSNTDVSTQLQWQRSEDPHGNLWLAIVIDPLRSITKGVPEMKAFRVFPPDYTPPLNETPDGRVEVFDSLRVAKWGPSWSRYYELEISYFMSSLAQTTLGNLKNNFLWQSTFTSSPLREPEQCQRFNEKTVTSSARLEELSDGGTGRHRGGLGAEAGAGAGIGASRSAVFGEKESSLSKACQVTAELAVEQSQRCTCQLGKSWLFSTFQRAKELKKLQNQSKSQK